MAQQIKRKQDIDAPSGMSNKGVLAMLDFYPKARNVRKSEPFNLEATWERLSDFYNETFQLTTEEDFQVRSKLLFQSQKKIVQNMKRPARRFVSDGLNNFQLGIVRDAVDTIQDKGGLNFALTEGWGVFNRFTSLGNSWIRLSYGKDEELEESPIKYTIGNLMSVYIDPFAKYMRTPNGQAAAGEALVVEEMSYDQAKSLFPNKKFYAGKLPLGREEFLEITKTNQERTEMQEDVVEVGYYYNIVGKKAYYGVFVGAAATVVDEAEGDNYPFFHDQKPFIPLINFKCFPVERGFYSQGLWALLYDYALVQKKLRNNALLHVEDNVNPLVFMSIQGKASAITNQALQAREARKMGEKAFIINELDSLGGSSNLAKLEQLNTPPLTGEYERILNDLTVEIKRMGINLDELDRPASQKATTTLAEEAAKTAFIEDIIENNLEAFKELDEFTMSMMLESIPTDSEMGVITKARGQNGEKIVMGDIVDALGIHEVQVDVESRTGSYKTPAFEVMANQEALQLAAGTPLQAQLIAKGLQMRGIDATEDDLVAQLQQAQQLEGEVEAPDQGTSQQAQMQQLLQRAQPTV